MISGILTLSSSLCAILPPKFFDDLEFAPDFVGTEDLESLVLSMDVEIELADGF